MKSDNNPFRCLPRELILCVFYSSSSFLDVLHFAATCRYIQAIWRDNVYTIYNHIGRHAIPYHRYARELLACQTGTPLNAPVTVQDVVQLTRNSLVAEKSADRFNERVMLVWRKGRFPSFDYNVYLFNKNAGPIDNCYIFSNGKIIELPPYLTKTERTRFIRSLYKLWGLVLLDDETKKEKIKTFVFKDVVAIYDLSHANSDLIQDKQILQMAENPCLLSDVSRMLYPLLDHFVVHVLGDEQGYGRRLAPLEWGWHGRVFFWDSYYDDHKDMITKHNPMCKNTIPNISAVWYDTDDEMD